MRATAVYDVSNLVDVYNGATGAWSTAQLSVARFLVAAASVGNVALFAGGRDASAFVVQGDGGGGEMVYCCVHVLFSRVLRYYGSVCPATDSSLMRATADGVTSDVVDVYNGATGAWSTAQLSVARFNVAAASVGSLALFAGGAINDSAFGVQGDGGEGELFYLLVCEFFALALAAVLSLYLPCDRFLSHARHCRWCV